MATPPLFPDVIACTVAHARIRDNQAAAVLPALCRLGDWKGGVMTLPEEHDVSGWIQRARGGDPQALGYLLQMHRDYLLLLAESRLYGYQRRAFSASDAVQETFARAHGRFHQFRGSTEKELMAWLRRILAHSIINLARGPLGLRRQGPGRERRFCELLDSSSEAAGPRLIAPDSSPSSRASRCERELLLAEALQQLPDHHRQVILLRHMQRLPFAEIASRMGRTLDSVEKLWVRALARLRQLLMKSLDEEA